MLQSRLLRLLFSFTSISGKTFLRGYRDDDTLRFLILVNYSCGNQYTTERLTALRAKVSALVWRT